MTRNRFEHIKSNIDNYKGQEVTFRYYIPSADKYATATGYIVNAGRVGTCNEDSFIISERGRKRVVYYTQVQLTSDKNLTLKEDGKIEYNGIEVGIWNKRDLWKENKGHRDKSGNLLVHYIFTAKMNNGKKVFEYTDVEMKDSILNTLK